MYGVQCGNLFITGPLGSNSSHSSCPERQTTTTSVVWPPSKRTTAFSTYVPHQTVYILDEILKSVRVQTLFSYCSYVVQFAPRYQKSCIFVWAVENISVLYKVQHTNAVENRVKLDEGNWPICLEDPEDGISLSNATLLSTKGFLEQQAYFLPCYSDFYPATLKVIARLHCVIPVQLNLCSPLVDDAGFYLVHQY